MTMEESVSASMLLPPDFHLQGVKVLFEWDLLNAEFVLKSVEAQSLNFSSVIKNSQSMHVTTCKLICNLNLNFQISE